MKPHFCLRGLTAVLLATPILVQADYRDDVGYSKLQAELSSQLPTGAGVSVSQIEASVSPTASVYQPDQTLAEFSGKTFKIKSTAGSVSGHATEVAQNYYSNTNSLAPGVATIDIYNANGWIGSNFLRAETSNPPKVESRDVENHSWIGSTNDNTVDEQILRRLDFAIQRDDFITVVGLNNNFGNPVPALLGSFYNGLAVGLSNGNHGSGLTAVDGADRIKPDIVAPGDATSFATPKVGAAAALLLSKIRESGSGTLYSAADHSYVIKALLLAGATKTQVPTWNRTTTQPLDARYGAGQLNIYRSYHDLVAGQQTSSSTTTVNARGWDNNTVSTSTSRFYYFDVAENNTASGFSAILTWNRIVTPNPSWSSTTSSLDDLTLRLHAADGFTVGAVYDASASAVDNVEHIYQPNLPPGRYALEVASASASSTQYGLAWTSVPTVQVTASTANAAEGNSPGVFTLVRAGDAASALQVSYTVGGSATNGIDYLSVPGSVTFAAGETSKAVTITPQPDAVAEGDETVTLNLVADLAYGLNNSASATVTIHDLPFDAWRFSHFTQADLADVEISGPSADPDSDGVSNLLEYAFGLEPKTNSTAGLPFPSVENGNASLTFTRVKGATDLVYLPQISNDLLTWQSGTTYLTETEVIDNGSTETVKVTAVSSSATSQFLRLKVERP